MTNIVIKNKNDIYRLILFTIALMIIIFTLFSRNSFSEILDDEVEVEENSILTYYLTVTYDGVDRNGVHSDSSTVASINSGTLYVEDKIPEGLIFNGFVTTDDGTIGAVRRSDGSPCSGKVVDDTKEEFFDKGTWNDMYTEYTYHGLHFDSSTYTVRFKVENLSAGCELTVGIKTRTPEVDEPTTSDIEERRDFYNFATVKENGSTIKSNTVHAFMGKKLVATRNVIYEYVGDIPENVPYLPETVSYIPKVTVGVVPNVEVEGYEFSGWTTDDVTVYSQYNIFTMPDNDVVFRGSFTKKNTNVVKYSLTGVKPDGYILPSDNEYYPGMSVNVDSLKVGDEFNGYRFLGWTTTDATLDNSGEFIMPANDVTLIGEFEEITYNVSYQFYGGVLPPDANIYLPATKTYKAGENVVVDDVLGEPSGYKFLGWYKDDFIMPNEDVVIYGEWKAVLGTFEPTIEIEIVNKKNYYRVGDSVLFEITITNPASFPINNVMIKSNDNAKFITGSNYSILSEHMANIDYLDANSSIKLYTIHDDIVSGTGTVENIVEIKGALANNSYELADKEYMARDSFKVQSEIKICKQIDGSYNENVFQFHITGLNNKYDTWVVLENNLCETIYVDPDTYNIKEIVPQEYFIKSVSGAISSNNSNLVVDEGQNYEIIFTNEFIRKGFFHSFGRVVNRILDGGND